MPILERETSCYPADLLEAAPSALELPYEEGGRCWWAVYTKARQEKAVARQLLGHEVPFYLPLIPKDNMIRNKRVRAYVPLFQGYVFLYGNEDERVTTLTTNRISRIFPVPDQDDLRKDLANIAVLINQDAPLAIERRLAPGTHVRVKTGPLRGLEGTVLKRHSRCRLLIAVKYLQQGVSVEIDDCALEEL